jgi:microsomal dipeptidase-like Zn-dependent dipeptidase
MRRLPRLVLALTAAGAVAATVALAGGASAADHRARLTTTLADALRGHPAAADYPERMTYATVPEDRYAMAGGCYVVRAADGRYVTRGGPGFAATATDEGKAERFRFQALDLGKYLLYAEKKDFLAAAGDPTPDGIRPATDVVDGYVRGTGDETLQPARDVALTATGAAADGADTVTGPVRDAASGDGVEAAAAPSARAEWVVKQAGDGAFTLQLAVDDHDIANPGPLNPDIAATLTADGTGALVLADGDHRDRAAQFGLRHVTGCKDWPEIEVNVTGGFPHGATPYTETRGFIDAHLHAMAFEFLGGKARCGRPWHPYGVAYALVDCPDHEPGGRGALLEDVVSGHTPGQGHDTVGWPTFGYWPRYDSLTHEQVYYKWLERAWRGGLRMFTALLVDNGVLCEVWVYKKNGCNEMDTVRLEAKRLHEFERYIDAQSGGPGEGWFRIVTDPFEARRVINAGKLAVVMGIEVSVPLDCGEYLGTNRCTAADIEDRMQKAYDLGVRQMELTNKFDNALTGVTGDGGSTGVIVNTGNRYETGHYWKMHTCQETHADEHLQRYDKRQYDLADESGGALGRDAIFAAVLEVAGVSGAAPAYPAGPHCNVIGLSDLGKDALRAMMKRGMIFDPDHMSALARKQAMDFVTNAGYGGVVSSHSWADDPTYRAILDLGGVVTPHAGGSYSFVEEWRKLREWANPDFLYGIGFGSDVNGFSTQGAPRKPLESDDVDYPFTGFGGVTVHKQVSGERTYDVNLDGVDHYGLYPDWVQDGVELADGDGPAFYRDMTLGAEAYLQMWERAIGIQGDSCRSDVADLTKRDLARVHHGMTPEQVLATLGQPHTRDGDRFGYCAAGGDTATVTFDGDGRVRSVRR